MICKDGIARKSLAVRLPLKLDRAQGIECTEGSLVGKQIGVFNGTVTIKARVGVSQCIATTSHVDCMGDIYGNVAVVIVK